MKRAGTLIILAALAAMTFGPIWGTSPAPVQAQSTTANSVQLLFALDVSGSMTLDNNQLDSHGRSAVDIGYALSPHNTATDPNQTVFSLTAISYQWMSHYLQLRPELDDQLDVYARTIAFDHEVHTSGITFGPEKQAMDGWLKLDTLDTDVEIAPPLDLEIPRHSDYIELFSQASSLFNDNDAPRGARKVLVVVTDSLPCNPNKNETSAMYMEGQRVYNFGCDVPQVMVDHLSVAGSRLDTDITLIVVNLASEEQWKLTEKRDGSRLKADAMLAIRHAWEALAAKHQGTFTSVDGVQHLPSKFFDILAQQLALTVAGGSATGITWPLIERTLGIINAGNARFVLPPYQESLEALVFSSSGRVINITADGQAVSNYETLLSGAGGLVQLLHFDRPSSANWAFSAPDGTPLRVWVIYKPARAELVWNVEPPTSQFQTASLVYRIASQDGTAWIEPRYIPEITLTVTTPEGKEFPLSVSGCSTTQCESERFVLLENGAYTVNVTVTPGENWPEIALSQALASDENKDNSDKNAQATEAVSVARDAYHFLQPPSPAPLSVREVTFWRQMRKVEAETGEPLPDTQQISQPLTIPRSQTLIAEVWLGEKNEPAPMPSNITAELVYSNEQSCPATTEMNRRADRLVSDPLNFETYESNRSQCAVAISIYLDSDLKPINGRRYVLYDQLPLAEITVYRTTRLQVAYLDKEGNPLKIEPTVALESTLELDKPHFKLYDYQTKPSLQPQVPFVSWPPDTLTVEVAFLDEKGRVVAPKFGTGDDRTSPSMDDTASEANEPLPFRLSIVDENGEDVSATYHITMRKSDKPGIYAIDINHLPPGHYRIQVELLMQGQDAPQLNTEYQEYVYSRQAEFSRAGNNPVLVAVLHVQENPWRKAQIQGFDTLVIVIGLLAVLSLVRHYRLRTAPLAGSVGIYAQKHNTLPRLVWSEALPTKRNTAVFEADDLLSPELISAGITQLKVTTGRNKALARKGGAKCVVKVGGQTHQVALSQTRSAQAFYTDPLGNVFYMAKFSDSEPPKELDEATSSSFQ